MWCGKMWVSCGKVWQDVSVQALWTYIPSISTRSWLSVFSLSLWPPISPRACLFLPTASISSIKIMQGAFFLAWLKRSRTLAGPTPTNISRNSEPERERKGTPASPAVALANSVFPVPGGPDKMAPCKKSIMILAPERCAHRQTLGILAPKSWYC